MATVPEQLMSSGMAARSDGRPPSYLSATVVGSRLACLVAVWPVARGASYEEGRSASRR